LQNALRRLDAAAHRWMAAAAESPGLTRLRRFTGRAAPWILLAMAGAVVWHEFRGLTLHAVLAEALGWGAWRTAGSVGLTLASFGLLALIERLGLRWAGVKAPWGAALAGAFCANAFAHAIGFALLVGGAVRARIYARYGANIVQATQATAFYGIAFSAGMTVLGGIALLIDPAAAVGQRPLAPWLITVLALGLLAVPILYVGLCARVRGQAVFLGHQFSLPPPGTAAAQVGLGLLDCAATAGVVWLLLPHATVGYAAFVSSYVPATLLGLASHVPGGAGVFEGAVLTLLPDTPRATLAAAFLGYRMIYYLTPLVVAMAVLARWPRAAGPRLTPM
jgi:uncharacterized membrane protein YbhN (UPF0104 family)